MTLSPGQRLQHKKDFLEIIDNTIRPPDALYDFLEESDFWTAPASTKYHGAYEGGLVEHSLKVYEHLSFLNCQYFLVLSDETIAKVALFHDLCKVNFYTKAYRNKKMEDGRWIRVETYQVEDQLPLGHGEKSLSLLLVLGVQMTEQEMLAVRWHMGGWDPATNDYGASRALSESFGRHKLVVALHIADMMAVWM